MLLDENISSYIEDQSVEMAGVKGQRVVVVEAVDLDVLQAHLVIGKNGVRIHRVVWDGWN